MKYTVLALALLLSACGGSSPTAPTPPPVIVTPSPPVVVVPPPPVVPVIANYAGRWAGSYVVEQCSGSSGSMGDVLCSAPRPGNSGGIFQLGASFPVTLDLAQTGAAVNGSLSLGSVTGPVSGSVPSSQRLTLAGTVTRSVGSDVLTIQVVEWDTALQGSQVMAGSAALNIRLASLPGNGVVRIRLTNVIR